MESLQSAVETLGDWHPIFISDTPRQSASELRAAMAKQFTKTGLRLAVIDYLGLLKEDRPGQSRYKEVGDSVKILRAAARELKIPVVLLCQLNRTVEHRTDKRPILSDLKESGEIEQDSDVVIMLYRDEYYCDSCNSNSYCDKNHNNVAEVLIRKQRKGPIDTAEVVWQPEYTTFRDMKEPGSRVTPHQPTENTEETQTAFGYKTADGVSHGFPNEPETKSPINGEIPGEDIPF
jgi:replicative DNA helicase